jgi:class 3 adenylate cyclase
MLVLVVAGFTALTGVVIGGLAWREHRATSRALLEKVMEQTARFAANQAEDFLRHAESSVQLGPQLVRLGQVDPSDPQQLERFVLATLRANPGLSWVSYGGVDDTFVAAWRDAVGTTHVNHSFPVGGKIHLVEDAIAGDGTRMTVRRSHDHGYRPTERPYFAIAAAQRDLVWTEPYEFFAHGGFGITCAMPIMDAAGRVRGVFTVDFSLRRLAEFIETLYVSPRGHVFIAGPTGEPLVTPRAAGDSSSLPRPGAALIDRVVRQVDAGNGRFDFLHHGEPYLGHLVRLHVGDFKWFMEVVVPERDYMAAIDASGRRAVALGAVVLALAVVGGVVTARFMARPLGDLAEVARRIRRGDLSVPVVPTTRDEIGVLGRAMADMVTALRDREFVRGVLGRFVSPDLAERVLRDRDALRLGGELREVVVLFSDLRDFSGLSERLGAEAVIQLVNRYLAAVTPAILRHYGTIVDFVGDGIFVLFGAPFAREDAAVQAVRCAWAMQRAMDEVNIDSRKLGLPELGMGIAIHGGSAVVGNIGSDERVKYGAIGSPVNAASYLQSHAGAGEILVSNAVLAQARGVARVTAPREVEVKAAGRIAVHTLVGVTEELREESPA